MLIFKTFLSFGLLDFKGFSPFLLIEAVSLNPHGMPGGQAADWHLLLDTGTWQDTGQGLG